MSEVRSLDDLEGEPHANPFPDAEPKTVRLTLAEGEDVPAHDHPDREIVLYLIEGALELQLGDETHKVAAGDVARFDGDQQISPRATEDSTALLVLAPRSDG
ncbi:cupin domain-containing protein [Halomicrobium urmianum]|uniref:cupin domain-containing protein n=1 Tax=Halomicrobium urmianum TaxID=1586233 RepID=UPI001CD93664|nr:cupin domain-containing protein [Halomicrobium urmianum]